MNCTAVLNPNSDSLSVGASIQDICANTHRGFRVLLTSVLLSPDIIYEEKVGLNGQQVDGFNCRNVKAIVNGEATPITITDVDLILPVAAPNDTAVFTLHCRVLRAWNRKDRPGSDLVLRAPKESHIPQPWHHFLFHHTSNRESAFIPTRHLISAIKNEVLRNSAYHAYDDMENAFETENWISVIVLCGTLMEAALRDALRSQVPEKAPPNNLWGMIENAVQRDLISQWVAERCHSLRLLRRNIHPNESDIHYCDKKEAEDARSVVRMLLRHLLGFGGDSATAA